MIRNKNYCDVQTPADLDLEYEQCNFTQKNFTITRGKTGVRLFPGDDTPRTFRRCNLTNCILPPGSIVEECNRTISQFNDGVVSATHGHRDSKGAEKLLLVPVPAPARVASVFVEIRADKKLEVLAYMKSIGAEPK